MEEEVVVKTYTFDNKTYYVLSEVDYNSNHYVYLSNKEDSSDVFIRRVNGNKVEPLKSKKEVMEVLKLITK